MLKRFDPYLLPIAIVIAVCAWLWLFTKVSHATEPCSCKCPVVEALEKSAKNPEVETR